MFEDFRLNVGSGRGKRGVGFIDRGNAATLLLSVNLFWISATGTSIIAARWWTWSPADSHSGSTERATYTSSGPSTPTHAAGSSASR